MKPVLVCATQRSAVFVCQRCGARDVATDRGVVLRAAARHYDIAHPERQQDAQQLRLRAAQLRPTRRA